MTTLISALDMYDRPETAAANDALWAAIHTRLLDAGIVDAPETLTRGANPWEIWRSPDLLVSQTCGMPFRTKLHNHVTLIGTPDYGLPDCDPGYYRSSFVVHKDNPATQLSDFNGKTFAYNESLSQSGWAAPQNHLAPLNITFGGYYESGGHALSARAVADGRADIAALDGLTWALIQRYDDFAADLRVLAATSQSPGLPYITARTRDPKPLFAAINAAIVDLPAATRDILHLRGLVAIDAETYLAVPTPPPPPAD